MKTGFQSAFFHSVLYGGHFSSQSLGFGELIRILYLFLGDFRFQGKDKSFHIFTGSLRALTFQFCCGSFTIKLSRKAITVVQLVCVPSFII